MIWFLPLPLACLVSFIFGHFTAVTLASFLFLEHEAFPASGPLLLLVPLLGGISHVLVTDSTSPLWFQVSTHIHLLRKTFFQVASPSFSLSLSIWFISFLALFASSNLFLTYFLSTSPSRIKLHSAGSLSLFTLHPQCKHPGTEQSFDKYLLNKW